MRLPKKGEVWVWFNDEHLKDLILLVDHEDVCYCCVNGGETYVLSVKAYIKTRRPLHTLLEQHLKDTP